MMQPLMPALYDPMLQNPCRFHGEPELLFLHNGGSYPSQRTQDCMQDASSQLANPPDSMI